MVSVVVRQTLVQVETPDEMRGRVSAVNAIFISASNQLGEFRAGATAACWGRSARWWSAAWARLLVVALWMKIFPASSDATGPSTNRQSLDQAFSSLFLPLRSRGGLIRACVRAGAMADEARAHHRSVRRGGVADLRAALVGRTLSQKWGQPVIVENKAGASGKSAWREGASAARTATRWCWLPPATAVNPSCSRILPYDTDQGLAPVTELANVPNVLVVNPAVPVKTFQRSSIGLGRGEPTNLTFSTPGAGSGAHSAGELLAHDAGIDIVRSALRASRRR